MALDGKVCYFTFGRFQPPTTGHAESFNSVKRAAGTNDYLLYISQTNDTKGSNPLPPEVKFSYLKKMFPQHSGKIISGPRDPVAIMQDLMMRGYDEVHFLVGSDRVNAMKFLHRYNGTEYSFRKIFIESSGSRDADGDTFAISGTKMRRAANDGDFKAFRQGIPRSLSDQDTRKLMREIANRLPANFK